MNRPRAVMEAFGRAHPGCWKAFARLHDARAGEWPPYVYAPLDMAGLALVNAHTERDAARPPSVEDILTGAQRLAGLGAWRLTQQVFRFDPDLYAALVATPMDGRLPGEHFRRLPAWCVYIELREETAPLVGGGETPLRGAFVWLDRHHERGDDVLAFGLDTDDGLACAHLPLVGTLGDGLASVARDWQEAAASGLTSSGLPEGYAEAAAPVFRRVLALALYLCAEDADYARPAWPRPTRTKRGNKWFPPQQPTTWSVGERIGAALRRGGVGSESQPGESRGARAAPRPHIRSAHWHGFWAGPRDGERTLRLRWLPPILVNAESEDNLAATVRPVQAAASGPDRYQEQRSNADGS
jgi:hypothetical protein